jgi:ABC-2 type transport system ATP-binding protein
MSQPARVPRSNRDLQAEGLANRDGPILAAADLSFHVQPGKVAGFLGPNGARKSTSMRMSLALVGPRRQPLVDGRP